MFLTYIELNSINMQSRHTLMHIPSTKTQLTDVLIWRKRLSSSAGDKTKTAESQNFLNVLTSDDNRRCRLRPNFNTGIVTRNSDCVKEKALG